MDTFKKIYKAIVVMTIIAITILCLAHIGVLDLGLKETSTGIDETGVYTLLIAISILLSSFVFSRAANVIANRKNTIIAYFTVFLTLIVLLFVAVVLIFKLNLDDTLLEMLKYIFIAILYLTIIIFIFEIPQSNSSHGHFQILAVSIITIAFILNMTIKNDNKIEFSNNLENNTITSTNSDEKEDNSILQKIKIVFNYLSIAVFIINPMIRVLYIDKDYNNEDSIDDIISNTQRVNLNNTTSYNANEKYRQQVEAVKKKQQLNKSTPQNTNIPVQEVHEKVINPNFKPEDIPEAIIPTINDAPPSILNDNNNESTSNTQPSNERNVTPPPTVVEQVSSANTINNEPAIQTNPIGQQLVANTTTPSPTPIDINTNDTNTNNQNT